VDSLYCPVFIFYFYLYNLFFANYCLVDGGPFCDKQADGSLLEALRKHADTTKIEIIERNESINDPSFAHAMVQALHAQMQYKPVHRPSVDLTQKKLTKPRNRGECLDRLKLVIAEGRIIIGSGAGIGLSAKCIEEGGADLLIIYNSGRYRMAGRGSCAGMLSYGDANAIVLEMAGEVLPVVKHTPVLAGVCGTDPFRLMPQLLKQIKEAGFLGVQNFPTVGLIDGRFRQSLEETGMAYEQEIEMIRQAHLIGLVTAPYVFNDDEAQQMTEAGADIIVAHMGVTTKGAIGARSSLTLDECVQRIQTIHDVSIKINPEVIVLCHGGPLAEPDDVQYILARTHGIQGFFGASSMERLPTEIALVQNTKRFKQLEIGKK
jgi:predicted TIM-barrel enzyme